MKLYEFTYTDRELPTAEKLKAILKELLKTEAELQGWAPGYKMEVLDRPRWTEEGWKLHLEVYGDYVEEAT